MSITTICKPKQIRKSYHTNTKFRAKLGLLTKKEKKQIPKSTLHGFVNYDFSKIYGYANQGEFELASHLAKIVIRNKTINTIYRAYHHLKSTAISIFSQFKDIRPHLKKYKEQIVSVINRVKNKIGLSKACRFFRISESTFFSWQYQVNHKCPASLLSKCRHRWSHQISQKEEGLIAYYYNDPFYDGWPILETRRLNDQPI